MEVINTTNGLPYLVQVDPGTMKEHWGNETKQMVNQSLSFNFISPDSNIIHHNRHHTKTNNLV